MASIGKVLGGNFSGLATLLANHDTREGLTHSAHAINN